MHYVDIEEVRQAQAVLSRVNRLALSDMLFEYDGQEITLNKKEIEEWGFNGLSNVDFIDNYEWPENPIYLYEELKANAGQKGWHIPASDPTDNQGRQVWITHWTEMFEHDLRVANGDKDPGRPVIPH